MSIIGTVKQTRRNNLFLHISVVLASNFILLSGIGPHRILFLIYSETQQVRDVRMGEFRYIQMGWSSYGRRNYQYGSTCHLSSHLVWGVHTQDMKCDDLDIEPPLLPPKIRAWVSARLVKFMNCEFITKSRVLELLLNNRDSPGMGVSFCTLSRGPNALYVKLLKWRIRFRSLSLSDTRLEPVYLLVFLGVRQVHIKANKQRKETYTLLPS